MDSPKNNTLLKTLTTSRRHSRHLPAIIVRLSLILVIALSFPSSPVAVGSESDDSMQNNVHDIQQDIEEHRVKIQRLKRGIREQQNKSLQTVKKENNILEELEDIDIRLQKQQQKVIELEKRVQEQQELIAAKEDEISKLQREKNLVLEHLKKRTSAYYKMGKVGFLNVTFSSRSLPELLKFHDAFQTLIAYDQTVVSNYRKKIVELERARDAYALENELLQEFVTVAQEEQHEIDLIKLEKEELLSHIRTQKHLHDQAIKELEDATETLSESLRELKYKEEEFKQTFAKSKGLLPAPIPGEVITYFNQEKTNKLGVLRRSAGIAIKAPDGTRVKAVADGTIIFSGYLRGYGNTVIIHHGYQYYSVTSRLEKIILAQGQAVKAGDHIGLVSDTSTLIDEGLYFEIRHRTESQDPLQWLDISNLHLLNPPTETHKG